MLKNKNIYTVAIAGATGLTGRELLEVLEEREFPVGDLVLLASERSEGERLEFRGKKWTVKRLGKGSFPDVDLAFFVAGEERARDFTPSAVSSGAVVIDGSGAFSDDPKVPLIVPEINAAMTGNHTGIIACPSPGSTAVAMALQPIHAAATVRRAVITTFEPVSGAGKKAMDELAGQTVALLNFRDVEKKVFPHQIAFNCLPQIGEVLDNGSTRDEARMEREVAKVLGSAGLRISTTAVRVPVFRGYAISLNIETERPLPPNEARALLSQAHGVVVCAPVSAKRVAPWLKFAPLQPVVL